MQACFCPLFIVLVAGPWPCCAQHTSCVIIHHLTDYIWLGGCHFVNDTCTLEVTCILNRLWQAIRSLSDFYTSLSCPMDNAARFYPLHYICPLKGPDPLCVTFLAIDCEDEHQHLAVKFVKCYSELIHKELMAIHHASELLYCRDVWSGTPQWHGCGH